jgi:SpoVK/Ycf46/Vps4 family AAA+-type ATPase
VIATSNIPGSLDDALWRRFDLAVKFPAPSKAEISRFARAKAKVFKIPMTKILWSTASRLHSYADVERAVEDAARTAALRVL